jgi:myo-inositol 2-dehydrogenase / D-chiro-inositol 1-dehydrogenase
MGKVRIGLIGYGAWGGHHARVIADSPDAELTAIAECREAGRAEAQARYPEATVCADFGELVNRSDVDAVSIVLPSHLHHQAGRAALEAGKHVLMEKPLALDLAECDDLIQLAKSKHRTLATGLQFRFASLWGKVKELIDAGAIGDPQYLLIELWRNPYRQGSDGWRYDIKRVGNWILEEPIHFFDLARWYFGRWGEPVSVYARANARSADHPELQDNFSAIVNFPGGRYAVIAQTLSAFEHHQVVKVTGATGALWASWSGAMDRTFDPVFSLKHFDGRKIAEIALDATGEVYELAHEIAGFVQAVRSGAPPLGDGEDGRWSVLMCLKAQQSAHSGEVVSL